MDGDFSRTMERRIQACDTVILFDLPYEICMQGIKEREGTKRDDMPWEVAEADDLFLDEVNKYIPCPRTADNNDFFHMLLSPSNIFLLFSIT